MTTCLVKNCRFDLLFVSFVNVYQCMRVSFPFGFEGGLWDLVYQFLIITFLCSLRWFSLT